MRSVTDGSALRDGQLAVVRALLAARSPDEAFPLAVSEVARHFGASAVELWIVADQERIVLRDHWLAPEILPRAAEFIHQSLISVPAPGSTPPGRVWASGEPIWVDDIARFEPDSDLPRRRPMLDMGMRTGVAYPISTNGAVAGVLELLGTEPFPRDGEFLDALRTICGQLGRYIGSIEAEVRLASAQEQLTGVLRDRRRLLGRIVAVQEEERRTIAADIHDDSIQVMTAVGIRLQTLRRRVQHTETGEPLERIEEMVTQAIRRLRRLMFELRPPTLDDHGLGAALSAYLEQTRADTGLDYRVLDQVAGGMEGDLRILLYRIAQEALVNVVKHARATRVDVLVADRDEGHLLRIDDDGVGYSSEHTAGPRDRHFGVSSMRERAEIAGGWFHIEGRPGAGTTVECWVPAVTEQ